MSKKGDIIMEYSQVILEMLERIKTLESKVSALEQRIPAPTQKKEPDSLDLVSAKYKKLAEYLLSSGKDRVSLTYRQIEEILGFPLPETARKFKQSFWANTERHSYASGWMAVGYRARVDRNTDTVTFMKRA